VDESLSYLDNEIAIGKWSHEFTIRKYYNKPYDPEEWPMMPQTVNACCMQQNNEICFPAAILQPPFFSEDADDASNYGAIGVIIGHEITHNFDTAGRLFSKDGNMEDWWTEGDAEKFKELTENTQKRFDSLYALPFVKCDGALTLNENIAGYGGLKIAYRALEKLMLDRTDDTQSEYNWKQRFFISYAQVWANTETDEYVRRSIQNNCHSVPMIRVNGTLPMFTPWYSAFDVKETDKLYVSEDKRAKVW
jgi:putative endopeptidase